MPIFDDEVAQEMYETTYEAVKDKPLEFFNYEVIETPQENGRSDYQLIVRDGEDQEIRCTIRNADPDRKDIFEKAVPSYHAYLVTRVRMDDKTNFRVRTKFNRSKFSNLLKDVSIFKGEAAEPGKLLGFDVKKDEDRHYQAAVTVAGKVFGLAVKR